MLLFSVSKVLCDFIDYYDFDKANPPSPQRSLLTFGFEWYNASHGEVPPGSFIGGRNLQAKSIYVARALAPVGLIPGRLDDGDNCANINVKGRDVCVNEYDVLNGNYYIWIKTKQADMHKDKVIGGYEGNTNQPLYVCRMPYFHNGIKFDCIGKVNGDKCWISSDVASQGSPMPERWYYQYDLLVGAADPKGP